MLFGNPALYALARDAKLGHADIPDTLERLRVSISDHYSVNVLLVVYDHIDSGPAANRPRLTFIVETAADYAALHKDRFTPRRTVTGTIARRFAKFAAGSAQAYDTHNVHIVFNDFSQEAMGQAAAQFRQRHGQELIMSFSHSGLWAVEGFSQRTVLFYLTDADVALNKKNCTSETLIERCFELTKQYDEFDYFTLAEFPVSFDSKQRLDSEFRGSMFYYFR